MVAAIGFSSIVALAAIIATASTAMDNSLMAQEAMRIQTQKHQESLELSISEGVLDMRNTGMGRIVVKEMRIVSADNTILAKKAFQSPGLTILPLARLSYDASDLSVADFRQKTVLVITDLGNTFTAFESKEITERSGGTSMIDGMGINSRIIQTNYQGRLIYGHGYVGTESSLRPYNAVPSTTDFVAQILNTDARVVLTVPRFNAEYRYLQEQQTLEQTDIAAPNILSYSQSRTVGGSGTAVQGPDGITFSGTGSVILKINSVGDSTLALEGSVPLGSHLQLTEFDQNDLMSIPYDGTFGWRVWNSPYGSIHPANHIHSGCGAPYSVSHMSSLSPNKVVSSQYNVKRQSGSTYYNPTFTTTTADGKLRVQSVSETVSVQYCDWGLLCGDSSCTWGWTEYKFPNIGPPYIPIPGMVGIFDHNPVNTSHITFSSDYQMVYKIPAGKQTYLIAKPNGKSFTIRASVFDTQTTPYLKITDLPANVPYEVIKDGHVSARGMAQPDGTLRLFLHDMSTSGTDRAGAVSIYPESTRHRGMFSAVVFDNLNRHMIYNPSPDSNVYVAHAYVQIPVVGNVTVDKTHLDNALPLPYIDGSYSTGERIRVPIIPGYREINMVINGVQVLTRISDVLGGTGLKVVEQDSSTITKYDSRSLVSAVSATAGSVAYVVSTAEGVVTTSITATISGSSEIENHAYFTSPPPLPPAPPPRDPLKAYVETYRNGKFVSRQEIYFNANPVIENRSAGSTSYSSVIAKYSYPQTVVSGVVTTQVMPGDMVEFYLYANIYAEGPVPPIPSGYIFQNYAGKGTATASIHSGSILSS